ncbi:MAG: hypothetical protein JKX81_00620 [Arenicella sp.]|nr:hypothetical protein [Arenicella sp.]
MLIDNKTLSTFVAIYATLLLASTSASASEKIIPSNDLDEQAQPSRKFTSERIFDLEYAASPQISPDGKMIIYIRRSMDKFGDTVASDLWSIDTRSGAHRPLISGEGASSSVR